MRLGKIAGLLAAANLAAFLPPLAAEEPAEAAVFAGCPFPIPPPCFVLDAGRLGQQVENITSQAQQLQQYYQQIDATRRQIEGIGESISDLSSFDLTGTPLVIPRSLGIEDVGLTIHDLETDASATFFGAADTMGTNNKVSSQRHAALRDAATEGYAYGIQRARYAADAGEILGRLTQAVANSPDLRTDLAVNSTIKAEIGRANALQQQLLAAWLQSQSAASVNTMPIEQPARAYDNSAPLQTHTPEEPSEDWQKVNELRALVARARAAINSLGIVELAKANHQNIDALVTEYGTVTERKSAILEEFRDKARQWADKSDRGSATLIMNIAMNSLSEYDARMTTERTSSSMAAALERRGLDPAMATEGSLDPAQFIGTWMDPLKYDHTAALANELIGNNGALDRYIKGDSDNQELVTLLYMYNDVRLEEAWKARDTEEANDLRPELNEIIAAEDSQRGYSVTADTVTAELQEIVGRANALGAELAQSSDPAVVNAAARALDDLNALLSGNLGLTHIAMPALEIDDISNYWDGYGWITGQPGPSTSPGNGGGGRRGEHETFEVLD